MGERVYPPYTYLDSKRESIFEKLFEEKVEN